MSLILEALRKSEAERRRGLPPDVHAELPPAPARRARGAPTWAWLLLGLGLCALAAWLALKPRPAPMAPAAETARVEDAQPAASQGMPPRAEPAAPAALPRITPAAAPPAASTASSPVAEAPRPAPPLPAPVESQPAPAADIEPASPATAAPSPRAPAAATEPDRVLALGELEAGAREALPPLRMSMHLWNELPAQRFAIIDGRRVAEGDTIGEARVVRIERDGVLLEWQGRGIRLPVR